MESEAHRIARLTEAEREVLWLSLTTSGIEEIARRIERSPAAVEQRFARARGKLGVRKTLDAAHMLARVDHDTAVSLGIYAESYVARIAATALPLPSSEGSWAMQLFPTKGRPWNVLPVRVRLAWMLAGLVAVMLCAVLAVAVSVGISEIVRTAP